MNENPYSAAREAAHVIDDSVSDDVIHAIVDAVVTPSIDELLDAVYPGARIIHVSLAGAGSWVAVVGWVETAARLVDVHEARGYGPTRYEAIRDACENGMQQKEAE